MSRPALLAVGAAIAGLGVLALLLAGSISVLQVRGDPGPRAVPVAAAVVVVAGAAGATAADLRRLPQSERISPASLVVALATVACVLFLSRLGFVATTALFLAVVSLYLDRPRRHSLAAHLAVAAGAAAGLWLVFGRLFGVILPAGSLGF
ncbi:MAG: tripartite tricarboxylate transporter TctB family protein [Armatimonadota bacterium]|nr:tripartite tricarboxylate transporter TctB family protein [Armatimonadota bacterium]MDR7428315.1 tripartite tricarboxylate transporter TctB family protein [Armatimonadota bacterium]MDR7463406.1 tripartite tricarboxylate transporter TctB family protein [Armatimonadota bacterium]MDR7470223.1 tripartite tricarboxylate transporter TctB family protein [Armatimonadota bacterium]MDR7475575.1 tripartite tricarboxylate transporter TctB family protein [Armatimonadota bacterium]